MSTRPTQRIEALHLVALAIDAENKRGTKEWAKAAQLLQSAKEIWLEQLHGKRCPHCGGRIK